jgi:site-specific DNA-methyltransferase (adenine-specific)
VLDIFSGSGTVGIVALDLGCEYLGIELKPEYVALSVKRIHGAATLFNKVEVK